MTENNVDTLDQGESGIKLMEDKDKSIHVNKVDGEVVISKDEKGENKKIWNQMKDNKSDFCILLIVYIISITSIVLGILLNLFEF